MLTAGPGVPALSFRAGDACVTSGDKPVMDGNGTRRGAARRRAAGVRCGGGAVAVTIFDVSQVPVALRPTTRYP